MFLTVFMNKALIFIFIFLGMVLSCSGYREDDSSVSQGASLLRYRPGPGVIHKVLVAGDSIMEDFGPVLKRNLQDRSDLEFVLAGKRSTGLCRPDFYDWPVHLTELMRRERPDILVFCVGANDPQPIREGERSYQPFTAEWSRAYMRRVAGILLIARQNNAKVIWISVPPMGSEPLASQVVTINDLLDKVCTWASVPFVDTRRALTDKNGCFASFGRNFNGETVRMRTEDRVHVTDAGNQRLVRIFLPYLDRTRRQIRK